jgi:hypothetical protein
MAELANVFSWSKSRDNTFQYCKRQYYNHYYGSWGGWDWNAPQEVRELYVMKNLKTIPIWIGSITHHAIERAFQQRMGSGEFPEADEIRDWAEKSMLSGWHMSLSGNYRRSPKKNLGLAEHYYKAGIGEQDRNAAIARVLDCIDRFYLSETFTTFNAAPGMEILEVEKLDNFDLEGIKVWVACDLVFRQEGETLIVDWKTGREVDPADNLQLVVYAMYALAKNWVRTPAELLLRYEHLPEAEHHDARVSPGDLRQSTVYILHSAGEMKACLVDADRNTATSDDFPKTEILKKCQWCNFRRACGRE